MAPSTRVEADVPCLAEGGGECLHMHPLAKKAALPHRSSEGPLVKDSVSHNLQSISHLPRHSLLLGVPLSARLRSEAKVTVGNNVSQKSFKMYPKMYARIAKMVNEDATAMVLYLLVIRNLRDARLRGVPSSSFGIFCFTRESQKTCDGFVSDMSLFFLGSSPILALAPQR